MITDCINCSDETGRFCAPRKDLAPFVYELSRTGPIASCIQVDVEGQDFLVEISNGDKGLIRNDLRIMSALKEISPVMHKVKKKIKVT